jgi:outer membrane protein, multidrug efflux system
VRPKVKVPADFCGMEGAAQQASYADLPWWEVFKDDQLKSLIDTALANNYDLAIAVSRAEQARQLAAVARSRQRWKNEFLGSVAPGSVTSKGAFLAAGTVPWEADIWGRIRRLNESARAISFHRRSSPRRHAHADERRCAGLFPTPGFGVATLDR